MHTQVAPAVHQVILEPGTIGQFLEFESPRMHAYSPE